MPKITKKFKKGFGILEVLISSTIIIVVLGTLVFIAQSSLMNAQYMQERAQAISLAAEAIETVRQNRDTNYIDKNSATRWNTIGADSNSDLFGDLGRTFYVPFDLLPTADPNNARLRLIRTGPTSAIKIDGVNYTRKIVFYDISTIGSGKLLTTLPKSSDNSRNGFLVSVYVTWNGSGGKAASVELRELVTNSRFVY